MAFSLRAATREVLKHPVVQRLRHINQLGCAHMRFPWAAYNRLTHSVGVARLAHRAAVAAASHSGQTLTDSELKCIELAGLLHDVGHGPWSHTFDRALALLPSDQRPKHWLLHHEERGQRLIRQILGDVSYLVTPDETETVVSWINPSSGVAGTWLSDVVCNGIHGIDVDRMEYLVRDSALAATHLSQRMPQAVTPLSVFEVHTLLDRSRVLDNRWVFHRGDAATVQRILDLRSVLHRSLYQDPAVLSYDWMVVDALHTDMQRRPEVYACLGLRNEEECRQFASLTETMLDGVANLKEPYQFGCVADVPPHCTVYRRVRAWSAREDKYAAALTLPRVMFYTDAKAPVPVVHHVAESQAPVDWPTADVVFWK